VVCLGNATLAIAVIGAQARQIHKHENDSQGRRGSQHRFPKE
jgi:hypothetical protein